MVDLSPCPFCGSTNLRYEFAGSQGFIECNECGTAGPCDERAADPICDCDAAYDAWNRRTALARQPVGSTDEELNDTYWTAWHKHLDRTNSVLHSVGLRAVLARWGRPATEPVPVSERLPGPEDCDAEGRCWWGRFGPNDWCPDWTLTTHEVMLMFCDYSPREVWLPAHALPVPTVEDVT